MIEPTANDPKIVDALCKLYVSYRQRFCLSVPGGGYFIPKQGGSQLPLGNGILFRHVREEVAVSVYAGRYASRFVCFDVDDGSAQTVWTILYLLETLGLPREVLQVSTSGRKGFHVEVLFDGLMYTDALRRLYGWVIETGGLDATKVEFRPTHNQSIKLPLSKHMRTGNTCWYLNRDTLEAIEDKAHILTLKTMPAAAATELIDRYCQHTQPVALAMEAALPPAV